MAVYVDLKECNCLYMLSLDPSGQEYFQDPTRQRDKITEDKNIAVE